MTTILALIDWLASLNRWQWTVGSVAALVLWLLACECCALLLAGGYPGDRMDDDAEGSK